MKLSYVVVFVVILNFFKCELKLLNQKDIIVKLIGDAGYKGEVHRVRTEDGYFLKIHRVLSNDHARSQAKPVFIMHGMLATAADFLVTGSQIALGFLLADSGYDVWLGNCRGSQHSMKHENFSSSSKEFWSFSWHEIGYYDLPAMLDYMLFITGATNLFYIGHSQGTTSLLVLLSTRTEYNDKIIEAHLMAPSAFRKKTPRLRTILYTLEFLVS